MRGERRVIHQFRAPNVSSANCVAPGAGPSRRMCHVSAFGFVAAIRYLLSLELQPFDDGLARVVAKAPLLEGLVGPHASEKQLENQLKRFSNDPRKAANGRIPAACKLHCFMC